MTDGALLIINFTHQPRDARYLAKRMGVLAAVAVAHGLALLWLLFGTVGSSGAGGARNLVAIDMSADVPKPDAPAKPQVVRPDPTVRQLALLPSPLEIPAAPIAAGNGAGNGCSVASGLAAAISADPPAMAELAALPREIRSEADAVMVWNGAWLGDPALSEAALGDPAKDARAPPPPLLPPALGQTQIPALQGVIAATLLALPAACREVETHGPQFVPIAEPGRTTMLVIGSGIWRWSSLIPSPEVPAETRTGSVLLPA